MTLACVKWAWNATQLKFVVSSEYFGLLQQRKHSDSEIHFTFEFFISDSRIGAFYKTCRGIFFQLKE